MRREIPLSVPNLDMEILDNLSECIRSGWVSTGGAYISEFEGKVANYVKAAGAVGVQSGTGGLHIALRALGVAPGDEVLVPTLTFIAAVNPISYVGAHPVFMDCNEFFCMDCDKLEKFLKEECRMVKGKLLNCSTSRFVTAIVPVHVFGNICDMDAIMSLAKSYRLKVLEDATEALGSYYESGYYKGQFAGTIGDMGVYSFNANKIITTGGGGMMVSQSESYLDYARYLAVQAKKDTLYFVHDEVGHNYRMLNLQAALGVSQIEQLEGFIKAKLQNFELYSASLNGVEGLRMLPFSKGRCNHWFYSLLVTEDAFGMGRDELMHRLIEEGIQCRPVWKLIHTQKPYESCQAYEIEKAPFYESHVLNIPCSSHLTEEDVLYVIERIKNLKK